MASASTDNGDITAKYQKLATEYSKLRAQASVLKHAVLQEQNKNGCLREQVRQKEKGYQKLEQEIDSLQFRNKQLEHRVANLQEDLQQEVKKQTKGANHTFFKSKSAPAPIEDEVISKELQKKIFENAKLASTVEDKNTEIKMYAERLQELEDFVSRKSFEHADLERKLKKEIENLASKNTELESRLAEATSTLGSEDGLSVAGSDTNHSTHALDERVGFLERELNYWRTQYEVLKINQTLNSDSLLAARQNGSSSIEDSFIAKTIKECNENVSKEQLIMSSVSKKLEAVLFEKCAAEAKITSYLIECENLQHNLELQTDELEAKNQKLHEVRQEIQNLEENLATTRINYEEQISVMTEQLISLSEQLAATE